MAGVDQPTPQISIVIPAFNASATIGRLLDSIHASTIRPAEIIVVDDGSTDNTAEMSRQRGAWVIRQENAGPATARNVGVANVRHERILFLDADVVLEPGTIGVALAEMERTGADVVNGIYSETPENRGFFPLFKCLMDRHLFSSGDLAHYPVFESRCALAKMRVFEETGGYNERLTFRTPVENEEFGFRVSRRFRMVLSTDVRVGHHFPGFRRLVDNYLWRTFWWMKFFLCVRKGLTDAAPTTRSTAAGVLLAPASALLLLASHWTPTAGCVATASILMHLWFFRGFAAVVLKNRPLLLPAMLAANYIFSFIVTAGATMSLVDSEFHNLRGDDRYARLFAAGEGRS